MNKVDFIGFIEVKNSNPNGDIDRENRPRQNDEGYGYMTDVCLKRKMKDCVAQTMADNPGFDLYIKNDDIALETKLNVPVEEIGKEKFAELPQAEQKKKLMEYVTGKYFDVRTFGGVLTSYNKAGYFDGQISGPVQLSFAESLEPVMPEQITVSRVSVTTEKDLERKHQELGKKWIIPYGVYKFEGHISAPLAEKTGFSEEDLNVLLEGIWNMYENNHSASAANVNVKKLFVFKHSNRLGNCRFAKLDEAVKVEKTVTNLGRDSYEIKLDESMIPDGVDCKVYE